MIYNLLTIVYFVHIRLLVDMSTIAYATILQWQKPAKNPMQKLPKNLAKTPQKLPKNLVGKNLLCPENCLDKISDKKSFMKILTQKLQKYPKTF